VPETSRGGSGATAGGSGSGSGGGSGAGGGAISTGAVPSILSSRSSSSDGSAAGGGSGRLAAGGGADSSSARAADPSSISSSIPGASEYISSRKADSAGSENASSSAATSSGSFSPGVGGEASGASLRGTPGSLTWTLIGPFRFAGATAAGLATGSGGPSTMSPKRSSDVSSLLEADGSSALGGAAVLSGRRVVISGPERHEPLETRVLGQDSQLGGLSQRLIGSYAR
jgi:hypothetical protein